MELKKIKQMVPIPLKNLFYKFRDLWNMVEIEYARNRAKINPKPIIILGNQKSGTSAIAMLLASLTNKSVHIDLMRSNEQNIYVKLKQKRAKFEDFIKFNRLEFSKDIIKEPNLTLFYDELIEYFPLARLVLVVRDPRSNIRSILDRYKIPGNLEQMTPEHYENLVRSWPSVFDASWLGFRGENYIEMLAGRWNYMADVFFLHAERIILVKYEDFLKDKIGVIYRLAEELGLEKINDISEQINIQYQPAGKNRNLKYIDFFGERNLERIERICGERMKKLEYY
ncbi:MAG: sulfotransferase [candidate division WOR-3 bacterium]